MTFRARDQLSAALVLTGLFPAASGRLVAAELDADVRPRIRAATLEVV